MRPQELTIGDWVFIEDAEKPNGLAYTKVVCLTEDNTEWLHPIPLTADILNANGFILRGKTSIEDNDIYYKVYVCDDNKAYEIHYRPLDGQLRLYWKNTIFGIHFVHELQNALRLCGLNEFADNFKIK